MRLASYRVGTKPTFGLLRDDGVVDASHTGCASLKAWIAEGLPGLKQLADSAASRALAEVTLLPPLPDAAHIVGIGLNTKSHFEETAALKKRTPGDYPKYPRLFLRSTGSLVGDGAALVVPGLSDTLDYEGEIGLVIGKSARNVQPGAWRDHVIGVTCFNDGSVRGYQRHSDQVTAGKNFVASGACGPAILTLDEIPDIDSLQLTLDVNGERRQHLTMDDLIFSFGELLAYTSQPFALQPGDVIATGSPSGIGALRKQYLRAGDAVTIALRLAGRSEPLLRLSNPVAAE